MKNSKNWYTAIGIVVVIVIIGWLFAQKSHNSGNGSQNKPAEQTQSEQLQPANQNQADNAQQPQGNTWEGTLKVSDSAQKGNLMLVMSDHTVYIRTMRDFSDLIGKNVVVTYDGTLDNFRLGNIVAK